MMGSRVLEKIMEEDGGICKDSVRRLKKKKIMIPQLMIRVKIEIEFEHLVQIEIEWDGIWWRIKGFEHLI